jgi:tyrosine-protein phosphatase YwqE
MLSRIFGSKKSKEAPQSTPDVPLQSDWSFLVADMHSHFVPGIDDGAQTMEDSITLIKGMQAMGYKSIITTPHIKFDHYPNTAAIIQNGLHELQHALNEREIHIPIKAAAEYFVDDNFVQLLHEGQLLTIHKNEVLIEFSFVFEPSGLFDTIFKIQTKGYKPILAHPERYPFFHNKLNVYSELKDRGCLLQLNTLAVTGYYGRNVKGVAEYLMKKGLYDYCGTDMHHIRHKEAIEKLQESKTFHALQTYPFLNARLQMI